MAYIPLSDNWGIWNSVTKRFVFGISEETKQAALREFRKVVLNKTYFKYRYEAKRIPVEWVNPPNKSILIRRSNR